MLNLAVTGRHLKLRVAAMLLGLLAALSSLADPQTRVIGSKLQVTLENGQKLEGTELIGIILSIAEPDGPSTQVRIDGVTRDPRDASKELLLYDLKQLGESGSWQSYCAPDPEGLRAALFLADEHPGSIRITCTAGVIGKCIRMGYVPWGQARDGVPMTDYHSACARMMRAEYCGDGQSFTQDGTLVDVQDRLGIRRMSKTADLAFEAAWNAEGAICVARTRKPNLLSLDELKQRCPRIEVGSACHEQMPGALLFNRSRP